MRVVRGEPWKLEDAEDLRSLSVTGKGEIPGVVDGRHVWIDIDKLREAGPGRDDWVAAFEAMIAYARDRGWVRDGAVRAHIEE